ncbi:MAG: hypothetical protein ABWZ02_12470, partial [Nakamurella sp.]
CTDGPGGTAVDVLPAGPLAGDAVRASLDACGYQEGQQLAVQYPSGEPTQLSLAGTDAVDDRGTSDQLLPIGLLIAALLAVAAGVAVWLDSRRGNRQPAHRGVRRNSIRDDDVHSADRSGGDTSGDDTSGGDQALTGPKRPRATGSAALAQAQIEEVWPDLASLGFGETDWPVELPATATARAGQHPVAVDLVFPFTSSLADSLHDELFTHRRVYS